MLLSDLQNVLFQGIEDELTYQNIFLESHRFSSSGEWDFWVSEDDRYIPWKYCRTSQLCYVQTEAIQLTLHAVRIEQARILERCRPVVTIFWSRGMTQRSALLSIIFQILQQKSEILLYRNPSEYYLNRLKANSDSFETLWQIFLEILSRLPGLLCLISLVTDSEEEDRFVQTWAEFFKTYSGPPVNFNIYHVTSPKHCQLEYRIGLDDFYDVEYAFDVCDNLCRVIWAEALDQGMPKKACYAMWDSYWRATRYYLLVKLLDQFSTSFDKALTAATVQYEHHTGFRGTGSIVDFLNEWWKSQETRSAFRTRFSICMRCIPHVVPEGTRSCLQDVVRLEIQRAALERQESIAIATSSRQIDSQHSSDWSTCVLSPLSRTAIWDQMKTRLDVVAAQSFERLDLDLSELHLESVANMPEQTIREAGRIIIDHLQNILFESTILSNLLEQLQGSLQSELVDSLKIGLEIAPFIMLTSQT